MATHQKDLQVKFDWLVVAMEVVVVTPMTERPVAVDFEFGVGVGLVIVIVVVIVVVVVIVIVAGLRLKPHDCA